MTSVEEALARAEELLASLNEKRDQLEQLAAADDVDGEAAVDLIAELAELAPADRGGVDARSAHASPDAMSLRGLTSCGTPSRRISARSPFAPELGRLEETLRYALDSGGKRVRPVLCLAVAEAAGGDVEAGATGCGCDRARAHVLARPRRPARA